MQLFTATFVKNKCIFLTILLQQNLALVVSFSGFRTGASLRPKKYWVGVGWDGLRIGCGLEVCGVGAGKISQAPAGAGRDQTQNYNPRRTLVSTQLSWCS